MIDTFKASLKWFSNWAELPPWGQFWGARWRKSKRGDRDRK